MPTVDILMATCNGERYVAEQVESILWQDYDDWRLLASDDCSTDGTLAVVRGYERRDPRIQVVSEGERHGSAKANFMHLLTVADAPYAMFCDQDDVWLPDKVRVELGRMRALEAQHGADVPCLVFSDMVVVDEGLNVLHPSFEGYSHIDPRRTQFRQLLAQSVAAGCSMMVNRALVRRMVESAPREGGMIIHDWWACLIASAMGAIGSVAEATVLYRQHNSNAVGAVAFKPTVWLTHIDRMTISFAKKSKQAKAFLEEYHSWLGSDDIHTLVEFTSVNEACFPASVMHLVRSGCWMQGIRRIGQLLAVMLQER